MAIASIHDYHAAQVEGDRRVCEALRDEIERALPEAEGRIWHAHPVWFLAGNPIVGYSRLKSCIRLLFWSGQSFVTPGLTPEGRFKAAEARFTSPDGLDRDLLRRWLHEARSVQWNYRNIVRRKGVLERIG